MHEVFEGSGGWGGCKEFKKCSKSKDAWNVSHDSIFKASEIRSTDGTAAGPAAALEENRCKFSVPQPPQP